MTSLSVVAFGVLVILVLVLLSAFFSSSESAIFSLSPDSLDDLDRSDPSVARLRELRADPHRLLVTILVGNNVVNMAIASISTALLVGYLPAGPAVSVATVFASCVVLVFGEIVPKSYGLSHAREWALDIATPIAIVETVLYPLVVVFDHATRGLNAVIGGDTPIEGAYQND